MNKPDNVKKMVKDKYAHIAEQTTEENAKSCCGVGGCCTVDYAVFAEDYSKMQGYVADADLGLGCGIPTEFAQMKPGDIVIDLGSGAGNDVFVSRAIVGEKGKVIGVDMTEAMIVKARANCEKLGFKNVEFRLGEIEKLPIASGIADVVISNCVLNLVPNKEKAFQEIFRVLKTGGRFSISDVVTSGLLPEKILGAAELYVGCVAGALKKSDYLATIQKAGFENIRVVKEKPVTIPDEILLQYLGRDDLDNRYHASNNAILSITVYAEKQACCAPGCCGKTAS
ncbi:MAG: arsenite methyltransferase [Ignavibacteriales bacterium]|nr:arsenite methyltransferase [Ignavibacteriales bacterium]